VSPALANFLFEAVNFLLLAAALGWLLFRPVRRALDAERERHVREENELKRLRSEAESLAKEAQATREGADREATERRAGILTAAQAEAARILDAARKTQGAERHALAQELESSRNAQAAAVADTVGRIAAESVSQLLARLEGPSLDAALVAAACAQLQTLPSSARGPAALVESAHPLDAQSRKLLEGALGAGFAERTVGELSAGVRVTTPAGQVDATALSLARQASRAVASAASDPDQTPGGGDG